MKELEILSTTITNEVQTISSSELFKHWELFLLGFITFLGSVLDHWLNPKKTFKAFAWYIQEFIYATISIVLGIALCYGIGWSTNIAWVITIIMGLVGSTVIRKIRKEKDGIADKIIDKATDKLGASDSNKTEENEK